MTRTDEASESSVSVILERALRRAVAAPSIILHVQLAVVLVWSNGSGSALAVAALHLLAATLCAATLVNQRISIAWLVGAGYALVFLDYWITAASDSPDTMAANWLCNITSASAALLLPRTVAVTAPLVGGGTLTALLILHHPDWPPNFQTGVVVTQTAIMVMCRVGVRSLRRFVGTADREAAAAERDRRSAAVALSASRESAEAARTLHDTVINTLGALANGGRGTQDLSQVQVRCASDLEVIRSLAASAEPRFRSTLDLDGLAAASEIEVRRSGLDDTDLDLALQGVEPRVLAALRGALWETLLNASKHSGSDHVELSVVDDPDGITVSVRDHGIGFDPDQSTSGHGLRGSIMERSADAGIHVFVSSRPHAGTEVSLRLRTDVVPEVRTNEFAAGIATTRRRTAWIWPLGVALVGAAIEALNRPGTFGWTWAMLALLVGVTGISWLARRGRDDLPWPAVALLVVSTPTAFELSAAGVGFGSDDVELWQCLGVTGPAVLLLYLARSRWPFVIALVAFVVGTGVTTWLLMLDGRTNAGVIPVGAVSALAVIVALYAFHDVTVRIGAQATLDHEQAELDRLEVATRESARQARGRWRAAGLHAAGELFDGIVTGRLDPTDDTVRASCSAEEHHLRQLLLLSPELLHLGEGLVQAVSEARERGVLLTVRTGDLDAPDAAAGAAFSSLVHRAVAATEPGQPLTVGVFPTTSHGVLTLVGSETSIPPLDPVTGAEAWTAERTSVGDQTWLEVTWPRS